MSNEPIGDFGKKIKNTLQNALKSGDFSSLKEIGPAAEKMVKDIGDTLSPKMEGKDPGANKTASNLPHEPEVHPKDQNHQQRPAWAGTNWNGWGGRKKRKNPFGSLPVVLGVLGIALFGVSFLVSSVLTLMGVALSSGIPLIGLSLGGMVVSSFSLGIGTTRRSLGRRINTYHSLLEQKNVQTFDELAARTACTPAQVKKDIQKAMKKGLLPSVRLDNTGNTVMLGDEAYTQYIELESVRKQKELDKAERDLRLNDPKTAELEKFKVDGAAAIRSIHEANEAIEDEEMSGKMDRLEVTVGKIFAYVQKKPAKIPDTRKMMGYYLPTTLKLLREYRKYNEMDVQVPSVLKAKEDISSTLDTVDVAFNNLLESLYQDDTLDVKTDIKVLQAMLKQEGLTGEEFELSTEQENGDSLRL